MKPLLAVMLLALLFPAFVFAAREGESCDYAVYGDTECDPASNLYCINLVCTNYTGSTTEYCTDSDGNNIFTAGSVSYLYRGSTGAFIEGTIPDECLYYGSPIDSCTASRSTDCGVEEFVCIPSSEIPYSSSTTSCSSGCDSGKCLDSIEPDSWISVGGTFTESTYPGSISGGASDTDSGLQKVELLIKRNSDNYYWDGSFWSLSQTWLNVSGLENWAYSMPFSNLLEGYFTLNSRATDNYGNTETSLGESQLFIVLETPPPQACEYAVYGDSECDTANNYFCVEDQCTYLADEPIVSCTDSDDLNEFIKGTLDYTFRQSDGGIVSGTKIDKCTGSTLTEYFCLSSLPSSGKTYNSNTFVCNNDCLNGVCKPTEGTEPPAGFEFPDLVSDTELLQFIDQWAKGTLSTDEEENDAIIMQLIEIWKES